MASKILPSSDNNFSQEIKKEDERIRRDRERDQTEDSRISSAIKSMGRATSRQTSVFANLLKRTSQGITGKGKEYDVGYQRALGERDFSKQRVKRPFGTVLILLLLYLAFSLRPFQVLPVFSFLTIFWAAFVLYLFLSKNYMWAVVFIIIFPLFNYAFAQDLFATGQLLSSDLKEKIPVQLRNPFDSLKNYIYGNYANFGSPDVVEPELQKGVQILTFETSRVFQEKKPVQIDAKVQVDGLYDSVTQTYQEQLISFSCYEEDKNGKKIQEGDIVVEDKPISVLQIKAQDATKTSVHYVSCRFKDGMQITTTGTPIAGALWNVEEGTQIGNQLRTKKRVVFEARTKTLQIAGLKLWNVQEINAPEDITKVVNDPTLQSDGKSKAQCRRGCGGPYFLTLDTGVMPITEEKSPTLTVSFVKNELRYGTLASINSVRVIYPDALAAAFLIPGDYVPCDFTAGFTLKDDVLKKVNDKLTSLLQSSDTQSAEDPLLLTFQCGYKINQPLERLGFYDLTARADYDIVIKKLGLVDIYRDLASQGSANNA